MLCLTGQRRARPRAAGSFCAQAVLLAAVLDVHCCRRAGPLLQAPYQNRHDILSVGVSVQDLSPRTAAAARTDWPCADTGMSASSMPGGPHVRLGHRLVHPRVQRAASRRPAAQQTRIAQDLGTGCSACKPRDQLLGAPAHLC